MRAPWSGKSISTKLMGMNFLVATIALSLACASFLVFDAYSFRKNLTSSLQTEAEILGSNSVSALLFNDSESATSTLSALHNAPPVLGAVIINSSGAPFATYRRDSASPVIGPLPMPSGRSIMHWSHGNQILLGNQIRFQGKTLGTVYILAETSEITQRIRRYIVIASLILLVCLGAALILTASMRRVIAEPVVGLAGVAQTVTRNKDYSLRAPMPADNDEVAVLVRSFNEMLGQIQERDRALLASRDQLEERVHERTAELEAANKELEAFSYSVAHDLRGPLDSIGNTTYLLQTADWSGMDAPSRRIREMLDILPVASRRMSALIDDLLNLSRSKSATLHLEPIDLSVIAAGIIDDLRSSQPQREVEVVIAPRLLTIADRGLMRVALSNLLGNAWKYTSRTPNARIEFRSRREDGSTTFFICDNGVGFDPQFRDRLFQPFQRLHTQEEFVGTGIGLATVARIVLRHGGKIWAESETGQGASFFFTIPLMPLPRSVERRAANEGMSVDV
jgi:signal transduction histidine kinase